eukprot:CAMPEP_0172784332 /NCGR_PEP_ID=MMETSP1074-20121228/204891_1 /TAXON_ID=2916 /ORGANISM="Ceratium fusus, Strain PA161109" /LENGTH=42 /DNA_ID= /DNA_START= /DNA_END= /DNA_ORIENTATION=
MVLRRRSSKHGLMRKDCASNRGGSATTTRLAVNAHGSPDASM